MIPSIWMTQALSQLLFNVFVTKIYFMKLGFCSFSGKIWETRNSETYVDMEANSIMGSTGTGTAVLWYMYWGNILYETGKTYAFWRK